MKNLISTEVVKHTNPFLGFFKELGNSIKGIGTGILLIIISFFVLSMAVNQVDHSKVLADLELQTPESVIGTEGMVKIHAVPTFDNVISLTETGDKVLYFSYSKEDYAVRKSTETENSVDENGNTVTNTYEVFKPDWRPVSGASYTNWSNFKLGGIKIDPSDAKLQMDTKEFYNETFEISYPSWKSEDQLVDVPQKERIQISGVSFDDDVIVVGYLENDSISTGNEDGTYFVSNKSDKQLVQDQANDEKWAWRIKVIITWFMMTLGFTMLFGPITHILGIIPGLGKLLDSLLFVIFGIISAVILFFAYVGMKYWWLLMLIVLGGIGFIVYRKLKKNPKIVSTVKSEKAAESEEIKK